MHWQNFLFLPFSLSFTRLNNPLTLKLIILLCLVLLHTLGVCAQKFPFEQRYVLKADGEEVQQWISLDEESELLHYKTGADEKPAIYKASDVVSFQYRGFQYYTLPLRDDYFTFFRVQYEGSAFAVLEKAPSYKALRIIADDSEGNLAMCQNRKSNNFYLCQNDIKFFQFNQNPLKSSKPFTAVREFEVVKLVYLAIEGQLKLYYMQTDERYNFWDDWMGPRPGKHRVESMLEEFIKDPKKLSAVQQKVKQDKLDIRDPNHLVKALGAVYQ